MKTLKCLLNDEGRVVVTYNGGAPADALEIECPDGFTVESQYDWRLIDGVLVYDPLEETEEEPTPTAEERITALEQQIDMLLEGVTEDE